jgi:hypothetical protein
MICLPSLALPPNVQEALRGYQDEVDGQRSYAERVKAADKLFKRRNTSTNRTFQMVRAKLHEICSGARRYGPKNNRYAVFVQAESRLVHVMRAKHDPIVPPPDGVHVLIDPRSENPLDFMELDLLDTFFFIPTAAKETLEYRRAEYTIEVLRLNARDVLPAARRCAFGSYKARLHEFVSMKRGRASRDELQSLIRGIQRMPHPTVWAEMKRQRELHPQLAPLFRGVPEAVNW